ncbi:hypothetical protein [Gottfriedia acidiceleris]|uniref:hypothetical protein n=1 Tax=Gottfriedia acidiceleris TaxID=371036 RepID=UPI003D21AA6C
MAKIANKKLNDENVSIVTKENSSSEYKAENVSSDELLWNKAFQQLDTWVEFENKREEILLQSAKQLVESVKQNQNNLIEITKQFSQDLYDLEKSSRVQLLSATKSLQTLFPFKSFEEINNRLNDLRDKTTEFISNPLEKLMNVSSPDYMITELENFIVFKRNNRNLLVKNIKGTATILQSHQSVLLNTVRNQVKNVIFPFHKYLERSTKFFG